MKHHIFKTLIGTFATAMLLLGGIYVIGRYILPEIIGKVSLEDEARTALPGESLLNKRAPAFNLQSTLGGRSRLSDYYGAPLVVFFWATWNEASSNELRIFDDYLKNNPEQASLIRLVAINSQEDASIAESFVKRGKYSIETLLDVYGEVSSAYSVKSLPSIFFISHEGEIVEIHSGTLSEASFVDKVDRLLRAGGVQ